MGQLIEFERSYILQDKDFTGKLELQHFDPAYWRHEPESSSVFAGRGGSIKIKINEQPAILKQYFRGGLTAKLSTDRYLWPGKSNTRPWREWSILKSAIEAGMPVPKPLGACVWRSGLLYRAAIIIAWIEDTETLAERLLQRPLEQEAWYGLGLLLRQFQEHGFRHADMNANNLLIDGQGQFFIIDFDKATRVNNYQDWQWVVLRRLQRSLEKIDRQNQLHYRPSDWQALIDGYQSKGRV